MVDLKSDTSVFTFYVKGFNVSVKAKIVRLDQKGQLYTIYENHITPTN